MPNDVFKGAEFRGELQNPSISSPERKAVPFRPGMRVNVLIACEQKRDLPEASLPPKKRSVRRKRRKDGLIWLRLIVATTAQKQTGL